MNGPGKTEVMQTSQFITMLNFSLVIPNFNQSHFLPSALESLRYQSVPFHLAVMDGGSTDNFSEVLRKYADITAYCRSAADEGQAAAIREGFDRVPGEIVSWLNADDYYFPGALDRVAACFEANPNLDVVYGDAIHVTADGFFLSYFPSIQEFNARDLTRNDFICQPACFVRRSAYERVGGVDTSLMYTMDWDLWCRLACAGAKFHYLHETLAAVRYYPGTKTLSGNWKRYLEIWRIDRKYGRRILPFTWLNFYLFDLSFKEQKTLLEKFIFSFFNFVRQIKKKLIAIQDLKNQTNRTLYGFYPGDVAVVGKCTIHLPWYDKRRLKKIRLRVVPDRRNYHTTINNAYHSVLLAEEGQFSIDMPDLDKPVIKISIECLDQNNWELLDFACELTL
jgi:glycosyltransferase involved in cell wall biosynthesis